MTTPGGPSGGSHKLGQLIAASKIEEAREKTQALPLFLQANWRRFVNRTSKAYRDYEVMYDGGGGYIFKAVKPGNVPGSRAEYIKEIDAFGNTTAFYKITYDNKGKFVHRKDKL